MTKTKNLRNKFEPVAYRVAGQKDADVVPFAIARAHALRVEMETSDPEERRIREAAERRRQIREAALKAEQQKQIKSRRDQLRLWRDIRGVFSAITMPLIHLFWIGALWIFIKTHWDQIGQVVWKIAQAAS